MHRVDISADLEASALELVLNGKTYKVIDVSMSVMREASKLASNSDAENWDELIRKQLALMLGVPVKELDNIGVRAAVGAVAAIHTYLTSEIRPSEMSSS